MSEPSTTRETPTNQSKFTPIDLGSWNSIAAPETGSYQALSAWHPVIAASLIGLPAGPQSFWGIPFHLPAKDEPRWIEFHIPQTATVPLVGQASYVVFAHFCNASVDPLGKRQPQDVPLGFVTRPGEHLANYVLAYQDGSQHCQPIRRRFEINEPSDKWGQEAFAALPHAKHGPVDWRGPYEKSQWGYMQAAVHTGVYQGGYSGRVRYWIYALPNPHPEKILESLRIESTGLDAFAIAGITLYHGKYHPLRHQRLRSLKVTLPPTENETPEQIPVDIDLGIVARKYQVPKFEPGDWLEHDLKGWGEPATAPQPSNDLYTDVSASAGAELRINGHTFNMEPVFETGCSRSTDGLARVELLPAQNNWVHVCIQDAATGQPTPVRIHFRTPDGRYIPPYGHRHEVNDHWFEDYGADLKLGTTEYAYVDGNLQVELPEGEIYIEAAKGFEYAPLRQKVTIHPGQRELILTLQRPYDWRSQGWITADTHVHFISPQTAWLEAQGEGLNLVNLLASQWGDLFTNVGDLNRSGPGIHAADTMVFVGTENRQHMLGHMSLLGVQGNPVYPMATGGAAESYLGDPTASSLAEWADRCRAQQGLVIMPHFPNPYLEAAADAILDKFDGVEIRYFTRHHDNYQLGEWYRLLNLGKRVAAVGGTDKMSAGMPVGGVRTYAHLDGSEFTFENWARAVRAGRTFTSSGPLMGLLVEGQAPGAEIQLPATGGTLEVEAWADCVQPIHELQLVVNGQVVECVNVEQGTHRLHLQTRVRLSGSAWIATRCASRLVAQHIWPVQIAAHTSPVYVQAGNQELFTPSDATYMLTLLEGGLTYLDTLSIPASPQKQKEIRSVFKKAQEEIHRRLHQNGHAHVH